MSNKTSRMTLAQLAAQGGLANLCSSASGNPLRFIAEAAIAKAEKAAAEGKRTYDSPESYAAANPLGGPAVIFDSMASRIRAGEDFYHVLADYGFQEAAKPVSGQNQPRKPRKMQLASPGKRKMASGEAVTGQFRFVIGVDPGVKTGFAVWDREQKRLTTVETVSFWDLFLGIQRSTLYNTSNTCVVIEIAHYAPTFRERRGKATSVGTADRMSRNVGGVTREAALLVEGFKTLGYQVSESRPIGKAKKAEDDLLQFKRLTGWTERTSQHARDAARLCFQG